MKQIDFSDYLVLDGAMGTEILKLHLPATPVPELYNLTEPQAIGGIHRSYARAGSQIILANTFGANPFHLEKTGHSAEEVIKAGIALAKEAVRDFDSYIALDIGPLGQLLEPMGTLPYKKAYEAFAQMVKAGVEAGADLIVIETMTDLREMKAAILAAKDHSNLPVLATMTFEANGRTFTGTTLESMVCTLESLGVTALGINCSLGPEQLVPLLKRLCEISSVPVIAKPNAGLPDPADGHYHLCDADFIAGARSYLDAGVSIVGGCCGTTPATIAALKEELSRRQPPEIAKRVPRWLCTPTRVVDLNQFAVVGERINPTGKKRLQQALLEEDLNYIARMAIEQQEAGASILDVNVGHPGVNEVDMLPRVVEKIQSVCDLPLLLDSSDPQALEAALRVVNGRAAINSVNGKKESLETILPLAKRYGVPCAALCLDERGIPATAKERLEIAQKIKSRAAEYGIDQNDLWFDALTLTVSAQQEQASQTLEALHTIAAQWKAPTILGVTNISFGLPDRQLVNRTFLAAAMQAGLRFAIINPSTSALMDTVRAFQLFNGQDPGCRSYLEHFAGTESLAISPAARTSYSISEAIIKGLEQEAAQAARAALEQGRSELDIAEGELIAALDQVGVDFEAGRLYLPSLLQAAASAQAVFEVLKESMAARGSQQVSQGEIVLATVQGDVHDIGKNIVKTLLENYGFRIYDLGKDVAPQKVVEAVINHDIRLVGLSALMTTSLAAMEKTIALLKELPNPPFVMVGGAVLTPQAAMDLGADAYAADARASVQIAREVFADA